MTFEETLEFINNPQLEYENEKWKQHPLYDNLEGSNFGRIRKYSNDTYKIKKQRSKTDDTNRKDLVFSYKLDKKPCVFYSSKFILECFYGLGNNEGYQCDHINSISYDNRIDNLRWVESGKENISGNESTKEKMRLTHKGTSRKKEYHNLSDFNSFKLKEEKWKKHPNYPNIEVSNMGRVIEKVGDKFFEKIQSKTPKGYLTITIGKNENITHPKVHRLVAQTWIPNPDNKPEVDHISSDKLDNRAINLRWTDHKENMNNEVTKEKISNSRRGIKESHIQTFDEMFNN